MIIMKTILLDVTLFVVPVYNMNTDYLKFFLSYKNVCKKDFVAKINLY